jgi:glycine/D-amino acid oxidase-like deaminating enzyme
VGGHTGYTVGPTCGALAADLIDGRRIDIDLTPFRPDRFAGLR